MRRSEDARLHTAIKILNLKIQDLEKQLKELITTRDSLAEFETREYDASHKKDLAGLRLTDAITAVLNTFDEAIELDMLREILEERGARLGVPGKPQRFAANLKTAIVNNPKRFRFNRATNRVELNR
jgi:chorismate-pyruvate lyase